MDERKAQMITNNAERLAVAIESFYKPGMTVEDLRRFLKTKGYGVESVEKAVAIWFREFWTRPEEPKKEETKEPSGGKHRLFDLTDFLPDDFLYRDYLKITGNFAGVDMARSESKTAFAYMPEQKVKTKAKILGTQRDQRILFLEMPTEFVAKFSPLGNLTKLDNCANLYMLRIYSWNDFDDIITVVTKTEVEVVQKSAEKLSKPEEPKMKRRLVVHAVDPSAKCIYIDTDPELAEPLAKYGCIQRWSSVKTRYQLEVEDRFDFDEVVDHIRKIEKNSIILEPTTWQWRWVTQAKW